MKLKRKIKIFLKLYIKFIYFTLMIKHKRTYSKKHNTAELKIPITAPSLKFGWLPLDTFCFFFLSLLFSFSAHRNCAVNLRWQFGSSYRKQSWLEFVLTLLLAIPCYVIYHSASFNFFFLSSDFFSFAAPLLSTVIFFTQLSFYTLFKLNRLAACFAGM